MMRKPSKPAFRRERDCVDDPPRARLEVRVDDEPLAWYPLSLTDEAVRHVDAMIQHPLSRAVVQLRRVEPGHPDTVLVATGRVGRREAPRGAGVR
jgi:hypothetical protein